jgi:hypothetical protein
MDLGVDQSPSPPIGLASPFVGLRWACAYLLSPTDYFVDLSEYTACSKSILPGLAIVYDVLLTHVMIHRPWTIKGNIVNSLHKHGLFTLNIISSSLYIPWN